jgi:hypothetical protein
MWWTLAVHRRSVTIVLINIDNTGNPFQPRMQAAPGNAGYPDSCDWPVHSRGARHRDLCQGNQDDFNDILNGLNLPDGRYLVSVLANGYKMGGIHSPYRCKGTGESL